MWKTLVLLLGSLAYVYGKECVMGPWFEWGECVSRQSFMEMPEKDVSHPAPLSPDNGEAHDRMLDAMRKKEEIRYARGRCLRDGTCPEKKPRASSGPAACIEGSADAWPCHNMDLESHLSIEDLGYDWRITGDFFGQGGNDVWAWVDPENQDEYALMGLTGGTAFVRITNPQQPEPLGVMYSTLNRATSWRDIKTKDNYAYVISEAREHGMQVFDLTRLRDLPTNPDRTFQPDTTYGGVGRSHNIVGNDGSDYMYIVGAQADVGGVITCSGGLHVVDVSDPLNPTFAGCYSADGYTHDAECVIYSGPDTAYTGREICFAYNEDSLTIVDVTDKENMDLLSRTEYLNSHYTHQGWLSEDMSVAFMDDELDEQRGPTSNTRTMIWDVSFLTFPILMNSYYSFYEAIDHNQYVLGDYLYQSNYEAGLQLMWIDQANYDLQHVAEFDVYPTRTAVNFAGSWSNYPYLPSGTLVVSAIEEGLFLLKPNWAGINRELAEGTSFQERFRFIASVGDNVCPAVSQKRECKL